MRPLFVIVGLLSLGGCVADAPTSDVAGLIAPSTVEVMRGMGPPDADPDACYGRETTPAVIETVIDQIMVTPAQTDATGRVTAPPVFATETEQRIVRERRELWFETPCALESGDPEFIETLQRALAARGLFEGTPNGVMDARTGRAIRAFQAPQGLDSPVLSMAAARQMGLVIWDPAATARDSQS